MEGWYGRIFRGCGFFDPDKPITKYTKKQRGDLLYKEPTKIKVEGINLTYEGLIPTIQKSVPGQGRRRAAAAHPRVRRARGHLHGLPRVRRHPAQRGGPLVEDRRDQHRRRLRDADQRPRRVGRRPGRAVGRAAARGARGDARLVRGDRPRLPVARPPVGHAVGRRGAAREDGPPPRLVADRRHLRLRRADDRAAPARHPADERPAAAAARQGQHGARGRAQARDDRDRRPRRRPRPGRRHRGRRASCFEGTVEGLRASGTITGRHLDDRAALKDAVRTRHRARWRSAARRRTTCATSTSTSRSACSSSSPAWRDRARAR